MEGFALSFINNSKLLAIVSRQFWREQKRVSCSVRGKGMRNMTVLPARARERALQFGI